MQPDNLDRDFHAYRQHRDPAALAAVFDAAAPRLLLVAMHLCRDAATAEDLVQTVFLQALRDVDRFDPRRPVLPWLLGMLEHRASDLRRSARVRREQVVAAPIATSEATPERAAAANEVRERVAEALQGMPRDYRDVLTLRLVHGLSAVDIAHAHGLPPATVRTRLRRGLELLRGALPRGIATRGLLALLAAELTFARDGMAAVRTKVLAAAAAGTVITFAAGWPLALAACLALATGTWLWLASPAAAVLSPGVDAAAPAVARVASGADRARDVVARDREPAVSRSPVADPRVTTVRGRVVDKATGAAMGGVAAGVTTYSNNGIDDLTWRDPEPAVTAADGTFAVPFVPSRDRSVQLAIEVPGYIKEWLSWEPLREGVDVDAGDVQMRAGTPVQLRLVANEEPLGDVDVYTAEMKNGKVPLARDGFKSDAHGLVDLGVCEPGQWWCEVRTAHLGNEIAITVPLQREKWVATIELRDPPRDRSISGVLVDTTGAPVAGVDLGLALPASGYFVATTRTDGRFVWAVPTPVQPSISERVTLMKGHPELEWVDDGGTTPWGTHDLRLVVRRLAAATLRIEVFDAATQQPIEAFGATCRPDPWHGMPGNGVVRDQPPIERHAGGTITFEDLAPGDYLASVFAPTPFADADDIAVHLVAGQTTALRVALRPPAELTVDVVHAFTDEPLPGIEVMLARAVPADRVRGFDLAWYRVVFDKPVGHRYSSTGQLAQVARGISDERGTMRLHAPADVPGLALYAGGRRCVATLQPDVVLPAGGGHATIRVVPAGEVRGTLGPRTFVERFGPSVERLAEVAAKARIEWTDANEFALSYPRIVLHPLDGAPDSRLLAHVDPDGTFAIGGVPAGRYAVHVAEGSGASFGQIQMATIVVDPARETPPLALDVAHLVPGRGTVRFFVDGVPANGDAGLARLVAGGSDRVKFALGADGVATTPWLVPGTYVPFVVLEGNALVFGTERLLVTPGGSVDATFSLQRRAVTITILEANGDPARDVVLRTEALDQAELMGASWCYWLSGRTDAEGRIVWSAAPRGRLRLRAFARNQDLRDSNVEPALVLGDVAADANAATFRMPR